MMIVNRLGVRSGFSDCVYDDFGITVGNFPIHCGWLNLERGIYYNFDYYTLLAVL